LGKGKTRVGSVIKEWWGAGWTGQPLLLSENGVLYIIQGAYDHFLKKINAETAELVWQYEYDDVIKGTGTIWKNKNEKDKLNKIVILQGSRQGFNRGFSDKIIPSYREISYTTGEELWRFNSVKTDSYSRDVDGSALIVNDTVYLGLENGIFIVFDPDYKKAKQKDSILQPVVLFSDSLYYKSDKTLHGGNLVTESSCSRLGNKIFISSGSGHIFVFDMIKKEIVWDFYTGSDIDGSPVVTNDSCIIVSLEKQYIDGQGGVIKLDPYKKPEDAVVWYFPTGDKDFVTWKGGVIGSVGINDYYIESDTTSALAAFVGIDQYLYVVKHNKLSDKKVKGFDNLTEYPSPEIVFKYKTGPSISTPIIVQNKLIAATYDGLYIFEIDKNLNFTLLDKFTDGGFESTPVVNNGRIYVASRNGYLYCFGQK
jgi:outer membrane protein assembly factor BamB